MFAYWALPGLLVLAQNNLAFANDIRISVPVLAATAVLALGAGVVMGLYPALQGSRSDIVSVLRDGGRTIAGALGSHRARRAIVMAQVAVSLVLLIGAGLLVTSFAKLRGQPTGFDHSRIFVAGVGIPSARYPDLDSQSRFWLRLADELSNTPGVERATLSSTPPLNGGFARAPYALSEGAVPPLNERPLGLTMSVTPGYFATLKIPMLAGRDFTERDTADAPLVAIVSRATSKKLGGDEGLLGRRIIMGSQGGGQVMEVIGIVEDVRTQSLAATSEVEFYRPVQQRGRPFMQMMVKTAGDPAAFESTARRILSALDATLPLTGVTTHSTMVAASLAQQRLLFVLLSVFALAGRRAVVGGHLRRGGVVRGSTHRGDRRADGAWRRPRAGDRDCAWSEPRAGWRGPAVGTGGSRWTWPLRRKPVVRSVAARSVDAGWQRLDAGARGGRRLRHSGRPRRADRSGDAH